MNKFFQTARLFFGKAVSAVCKMEYVLSQDEEVMSIYIRALL